MRKSNKILEVENHEIYQYYRSRLIAAALAQFEWDNLPETCDRRYLEYSLLTAGTAAFYIPEGQDFWLSTNYVFDGTFDVYGYPTSIKGMGYNAANIPTSKFYVCYDNVLREPLISKIDLYARLLYETHQVYRSNLRQQTSPYIVVGAKKKAMSFQTIIQQIMSFIPVVPLDNGISPDDIKPLDMRVDFKGRDILDCLKVIWAEALSMLGITAQTTKKERLTDDEVHLNRMADMIALNTRLMTRIDFCNKINKAEGLDLAVNLSTQIPELQPFMDPAIDMLDEISPTGWTPQASVKYNEHKEVEDDNT